MASKTAYALETAAEVVDQAHRLVREGGRVLLGITGAPGAGKSTFADALVRLLKVQPPATLTADWVVGVPMDGFHLADAELSRLGRLDRKGASDTFDVAGYVALLERLAAGRDDTVYAPAFERGLDQPVAGSIPVPPATRLVITEGNYLLVRDHGWERVGAVLDEIWYLQLDDAERRRRLVARHQRFGKTAADSRAWTTKIDEGNAEIVRATSPDADVQVAGEVLADAINRMQALTT